MIILNYFSKLKFMCGSGGKILEILDIFAGLFGARSPPSKSYQAALDKIVNGQKINFVKQLIYLLYLKIKELNMEAS